MLDKAAQRRHDFFRNLKSNFMVGLTILATVIALIPLFFVLGYLVPSLHSSCRCLVVRGGPDLGHADDPTVD